MSKGLATAKRLAAIPSHHRSGDRRDDLRGIQNLRHLDLDALKHLGEVAPVFDDYLNFRCQLHLHFGVRAKDPVGEVRNYCARLHFWPIGRITPGHRDATIERYVACERSEEADEDVERSVFVIVGKLGYGEQSIVGGIPSHVVVSRLDEVDGGIRNARETARSRIVETPLCAVDRELDQSSFIFGKWPARTVNYELPRDVVENTPVVVDRVPESGGERVRQIRQTAREDDPAMIHGVDSAGWFLVAFWLDTEGWSGVTVEEPACLSPSNSFVEARSPQLDLGTSERFGKRRAT